LVGGFAVKIRYESTIDHLVALNRYHYANSPTFRRQRLLAYWFVPALILLLALVMTMSEFAANMPGPRLPPLVLIWGLCVFAAVAYSLFARWLIPRQFEKMSANCSRTEAIRRFSVGARWNW
jgi:hypothetical protein